MFGAATPTEFLASDCALHLNLDPDTSSNAPPTDFQSLPLCLRGSLTISDTDATYASGYRTDSIRFRLLPPAPDIPLEYLSATASGAVGVSGQGTGWLTLAAATGTSVATANADYQTSLRSVQWHNDAAIPTPGLRTVEVIAFASGGRSDTAYAYLQVPALLSAGQDTAFAVCADAPPFLLSTPNGTPGGVWSLPGGIFSPQMDTPGLFSYSVANGLCPADTAFVSVAVLPLPIFSLGHDSSVCANQLPLVLTAPNGSMWQDGSSSSTFSANQPGLFWAEHMDANGCRFRDSILVITKPLAQGQSAAAVCHGQPYGWNGQAFSADTTVCAIFGVANGCDSTHCLTLSFFYPSLALDTSICSGQTIDWLGSAYASSGIFADTVLLAGCLTATLLDLEVRPPDTVLQNVRLCNGESHTVGGQTFSTPGEYFVPFSGPMDCDTVLRLVLTVQPNLQTALSDFICAGAAYIFDGDTLWQPGNYTAVLQSADGCDSTLTLMLGLLPAPMPQIAGDTVLCAGESSTLSTGSFASYAWSGGSTAAVLSVAAPGTYTVTVSGSNGCTATAVAAVEELPALVADWDTGNPQCHGDSTGFIELAAMSGGTPPVLFGLNGGLPSSTAVFGDLGAGNWQVKATDAAGCVTVFDFTLSDPLALAVDLGPSPELAVGDTYAIPVSVYQSGAFQYSWSPPDGLNCSDCANPIATATADITYLLLLSSAAGCAASDSVRIRIRKEEQVYVANIFSPQGDGRNAGLTVHGNAGVVQSVDLFAVYDRWGELLFESKNLVLNDQQTGWDGSHRGRKVLPGVYVWRAEIRLWSGAVLHKSGEVTVLR